jgi:hypothetical protein
VLSASLFAAVSAYVPPEEARRFGVTEPYYWPAIWRQFAALGVAVTYIGLLGASLVGVPVALLLAQRGLATVPAYIAASAPISLALLATMVFLTNQPLAMVIRDAPLFVGGHAWLALGFAVGARLPWSIVSR